MRGLFLAVGLLVAYSLIYTGVSYFWHGITAIPTPGNPVTPQVA